MLRNEPIGHLQNLGLTVQIKHSTNITQTCKWPHSASWITLWWFYDQNILDSCKILSFNQVIQTVNNMSTTWPSSLTLLQWSEPFLRGHSAPLLAVLPSLRLCLVSCCCHGAWLDMTTMMGLWGASLALSSPLFSAMFWILFYLSSIWFNSTSSPYRLAR